MIIWVALIGCGDDVGPSVTAGSAPTGDVDPDTATGTSTGTSTVAARIPLPIRGGGVLALRDGTAVVAGPDEGWVDRVDERGASTAWPCRSGRAPSRSGWSRPWTAG